MKLVRQFIQEMNGEIILESKENKYTSFQFNIPLKLVKPLV
ncbi:histidine kinase-, DNA gyrase B-, and HSP90-like ATPase family protein [Orientia chuto str. Dubai]|uniref:Histidine kinase-, DNA gyrase B-, and HSP90-like ATPase family protein n=1 Tax=Orientia chuto str. Dubai TaxID=1359168 RepID=A0A0F3MFS9_9RICK|nr:histidine kinase-, DNA gyrase B-, and HSP90-like ATPase family protein [Orientia chuto str. Dubai]